MDPRPLDEQYPDVMCDLETTGLSFDRNAIIQISAARFNLAERTIGHDFFNACLTIPSTRFWDEETRTWWLKDKRAILMEILKKGRDPKTVMQEFRDWAKSHRLTFWSKPSHFDHSYVSSYFREFQVANPFHYRSVNDMNSWIRARYFPERQEDHQWEFHLPFDGPKHDALFDLLHQIKTLFKVADDTETKHHNGFAKMMAEKDAAIEADPQAPVAEEDVPF